MLQELFYLVVGVLFIGVQMFINSRLQKMGEPIISVPNLLFLICNAAIMFAIMWTYGSLVEFETQAAFMGVVFYGGFGVIAGIIGYRLLVSKNKKQKVQTSK